MRWHKSARNILLAMTFASQWISGCGSSSTANQVVVTVLGQFSIMVPTQTQTITANVTGATDVSATFACTYTTTPNPTTATPNPKPSASASCDSAKTTTGDPAVGALSNIQNTSTTVASTATFTAPKIFPDQVKLPNVAVTITATSNADKRKTGTFTITFDSGIRLHLVPATATLATNATQLFLAEDLNNIVILPGQLTWGVTFEVTAKTNSADCSTGSNTCGSIDATGLYKAPATIPTAAPSSTTTPVNAAGIVTVFAFSKVDNARIAQASVTIVTASNITFTGISPSVAPQGGLQQDIFLAAAGADSQTAVVLTDSSGNKTPIVPSSGQLKVVFAAGSTSSSIGVRARLNSSQLAKADHYNIGITSSNTSITVTGGPFPLDIVPVRPTIVGVTPGNAQESTLNQTSSAPLITLDGGYFGPSPIPTVAVPLFNNLNKLLSPSIVTARRITGNLPTPNGSGPNAGLFPLSVQFSTTATGPFPVPTATTAYTNIAVIPDYAASNKPGTPSLITLPASSTPSAIALDRVLGYAVVTLAGLNTPGSNSNTQNNVQFISLATGTPVLGTAVPSGGNIATGVAVDEHLHVAAVVNYASRSLSVLSIPAGTLLATVDLSNVIPQPVPPDPTFVEPFPYSVGIDPFTDRALVAFASTNVGLIINLDPTFVFNSDKTMPPQCILPGPASAPNYCPIGYVTLGSGTNPQIAFEPGARLAYVTPGGAGLLSAVDLSNASKGSLGVPITSATRASNVVTIATSSAHNLNSGNPGTVLISGLPAGATNKTNFNGSFSVGAVLDSTHFQYFQADKDDTTTCTATCLASSGNPFLTYTISPSIVGIAVNPVTRQLVLADPNVTNSQITFIDPQSETVGSMTLFAGATGQVSSGAPELGATTTAFQPFSNTALSFNPKAGPPIGQNATGQVSLLDPSLLQRAAIVNTNQIGVATVCAANCTPPATPTNVTIAGALAVDSANNLALVVNSGNDNISVFHLGTIKSVHIESVQTPPIDAGNTNIGTPASLSPAVKITLGTAPTAVSGVKILGTGFDSGSQVFLDGTAFASSTLGNFTFVGSKEIDVSIPVSVLTAGPRHYALSVTNSSGVNSNVSDFFVLEEIPLPNCGVTSTSTGTGAAPGGVAIDEVHSLAVVTNTGSGCSQVSVFSLNPANIFNQPLKTIATGATPTGVAVLPSLAYHGQPAGTSGVAVVTNNGSNTVSILDLVNAVPVLDNSTPPKPIVVSVGTNPSGVAIDQETNLAVIANTGDNTANTIDLTPLTANPIGTLTPGIVSVDQNPIAVAIDPDRGTSGRGLAVVTCQSAGSTSTGSLVGVDIGSTTPTRATSASTSFLTPSPTGIVFDPSVSPALFYAVSTQGNVITAFNPDTSQTQTIKVGINPKAIAYNFQTSTILTVNSVANVTSTTNPVSNTISIVDSQTFATKATLGIGGSSNFAAAIQTFTNLAVIADHDNNRVLLFPLPK